MIQKIKNILGVLLITILIIEIIGVFILIGYDYYKHKPIIEQDNNEEGELVAVSVTAIISIESLGEFDNLPVFDDINLTREQLKKIYLGNYS